MEDGLVDEYILYVDGNAVGVSDTLIEAQENAREYVSKEAQLTIMHSPGPIAPPRTWNYDYDYSDWILKVN